MNKYQTFWKRWLASSIDSLVFLPFLLYTTYLERTNQSNAFIMATAAYVFLFTAYLVIGHGRYGQTLGKYLLGVKVLDIKERELIGYKRAFLRESVWFVAQLVGVVYLLVGYTRSSELVAIHATYYKTIVGSITSMWFLLEVVTMLFNQKRRALHDFIADSVVVNFVALKREDLQKRQQELRLSLQKG